MFLKRNEGFTMPSSLTIVMIFLVFITLLTWVVPYSVITEDEDGNTVINYNSSFDEEGNLVKGTGPKPKGIWNILSAPVSGLIESSDVAATIFASGGALSILSFCGALDAGIAAMLKRFKGKTLIALLMLLFGLMGTVYGSWEELPAYAVAVIPLFLMAGYDVITGIAVILAGSSIGNMASVVNPYSVGSAVASIGNENLTLGSGIILRIVVFIFMYLTCTFLVVKYAEKVRKEPSLSYCASLSPPHNGIAKNDESFKEMTLRHKLSLLVFFMIIIFCVVGYIPWDSFTFKNGRTAGDYVNGFIPFLKGSFLGNLIGIDAFRPFGSWYFNELSVTWLLGAFIIGFINKMSEKDFVREFTKGAGELLGVALVLSAARGIALTMGSRTEGMSITFIYWIEKLLNNIPMWAFSVSMVAIYLMIGLFLQSTSGVAGITMPIFASLASALFASSSSGATGGEIILMSAFSLGISFMAGIYPGSTNMGVIEIGNVPYNLYLKSMLKFLLPPLIVGTMIITLAPYTGLV